MKHYLFSGNESPDEIRRILADNSEGKEGYTYAKTLTEDELTAMREDYTDNQLAISHLDDTLAEARKNHKDAVKPLKDTNKVALKTLKTKFIEVEESVWKMPNHETGFLEFVNDAGEVVGSRKLRPDEKQGNVFNLGRAVNE